MLVRLKIRSTLGSAGEIVEVSPTRAQELCKAGLAYLVKPVFYEVKKIEPAKKRGRPKKWNSTEQSSSQQ
jgi:hypothetical protein